MFLKKLESVGFKSFAERIHVDFVPGMTAIVGPNGSGKSNITDAIRWVLGEQSAKSLRGSKMEDIIFQGSDTRNKLNVAEVTLVLDNSVGELPLDYEEVSVTRRVYRSGESEFYINKQACRLKDIVDLFMDSGLGREAFSIISQGKIEEILSSKAEERRVIFEEAAGVLKYKQRKKQAELKLGETAENLFRVEDIIYEIEQQLEPLKVQSETAKEYMNLKGKLKNKEISLLITEIEHLHRDWQGLKKELDQQEREEIEVKTGIQKNDAKIQQKRQYIQVIDEEVEQLQESLLEMTQILENSEGKKRILHERSKHFAVNKEKLNTKKQELGERIKEITTNYTKEKDKWKQIEKKRREILNKVSELEKKLLNKEEDIEEEIERLKTEYIDELNKQAADRNEKQSIQQQLTQQSKKEEHLQKRYNDLLYSFHEIEEQEEHALEQLKSEKKKYQINENKRNKQKAEISEWEKKAQQSREHLYQGYQYMEKLKSKKEMLESMKNEFQGFYQGVKAVLKARKNNQLDGIHGAVIDLMSIPDKFVYAMETALGAQAQHIVTTNDEKARQAIQWLKKTNNGRATFLPLQSIKRRFIPTSILEQVKNHPGYIGVASELVETDETYQIVVDYLMGHVLITYTLKDANELARLTQRKFRIVTLEGDVVHPGGSMSGGAKRNKTRSLFTRDSDLKKTTKQLSETEKKIEYIEKQATSAKEKYLEKRKEIQALEQELYNHYQRLQEAKTNQKQLETKRASIREHITMLELEKEQLEVDRSRFEKRAVEKKKTLQTIESKLNEIHDKIQSLSEEHKLFKENQEGLEKEYHQARILLAEQEERAKNKEENVEKQRQQLEEYEVEYRNTVKELQDLLEQQKLSQTEIEVNQTIQEQKKKKEYLTSMIQGKRQERLQLMTRIEEQERELKEENKAHQKIIGNMQEKELQQTRLDVELENRLSHLETEYTITFEKASQTYEKTDNIDQEKEAVQNLKQKIEQLGAVNLGAIDEYNRILDRYEFLTKQQNDLVEAKETLHDVIEEMDQEMKRLFDTTFTKIKAEFTIVFKQLFGGGKAELKLTDPNNLLDTGVEIIAQPPGKKLQNLGLLSGGERALTAIALLFAILRVRPVPFCVLDEVEAALDEANVVRFAKYVKQHSEKTQFIVITHRKGTMEEADVLYGVTMQESGVSRFVSVRLDETEEFVSHQ
ncbi:chromosome segregation protein SMC [Cerasibacillus terrae]|uniref:Chromosome partition protein Smc n=1 Tax=Cerasibacillus terrae TaxID=2498845 RepID=A0A5C8P3C3_9BACI|nr:chromosome segregation protein SMC [Cerasibacillus terrae]TXL67653.1 chromosome segregation protein SMC [Cerasibacillus terrae]